jgi:hypothetical protein
VSAAAGAGERFEIDLPGDPAYVATARMFASSLARQVGVDEEMLDDLKLAVSEACARALGFGAGEGLRVRAHLADERLVFEIPQGESGPSGATADLAAGLSLELVTVLFDDAELLQEDDGTYTVRFSVKVA